MSVAALEAPTNPDSPPETAGYRNLYIVLLVCGFILRFGFVLWKKTYMRAPGSILPFGAEICSIAEHIVRGQGFSSPFSQDTGPTAWIAPVYRSEERRVGKGCMSRVSVWVVIEKST